MCSLLSLFLCDEWVIFHVLILHHNELFFLVDTVIMSSTKFAEANWNHDHCWKYYLAVSGGWCRIWRSNTFYVTYLWINTIGSVYFYRNISIIGHYPSWSSFTYCTLSGSWEFIMRVCGLSSVERTNEVLSKYYECFVKGTNTVHYLKSFEIKLQYFISFCWVFSG